MTPSLTSSERLTIPVERNVMSSQQAPGNDLPEIGTTGILIWWIMSWSPVRPIVKL